jgi:hypothetical protein
MLEPVRALLAVAAPSMIERHRVGERVAETDIDEIGLVEIDAQAQMRHVLRVGRVEKHIGPEIRHLEAEGPEEPPERTVVLETPAAPAPSDKLVE